MILFAIFVQVVLLLYHQLTTWIDFFPFNGVRFYTKKERLVECLSNGVLMTLPIIGFVFQIKMLMNYGIVYYCILFLIELKVWWLPYFFKATPEWNEQYERIHAKTIIILPKIKNNPTPNLEHMILHGLTFITAIFTLVAFYHK